MLLDNKQGRLRQRPHRPRPAVLARRILVRDSPAGLERSELPTIHLNQCQMRQVNACNGRVHAYRAVDISLISICTGGTTAPLYKTEQIQALLLPEAQTEPVFAAQRETDGWLYVPVDGRCKVTRDGRLVTHRITAD